MGRSKVAEGRGLNAGEEPSMCWETREEDGWSVRSCNITGGRGEGRDELATILREGEEKKDASGLGIKGGEKRESRMEGLTSSRANKQEPIQVRPQEA